MSEKPLKMARRRFLGVLAAAPVAAQTAMAEAAAQAAGVAVTGPDASVLGAEPDQYASWQLAEKKWKRHLVELIQAGRMPDWKRAQLWRKAQRGARTLDPDIACMRSLSLARKVLLQAERNFERLCEAEPRAFLESETRRKLRESVMGKKNADYDDDD